METQILTQLGFGGILALLVIREVFAFISKAKNQEKSENSNIEQVKLLRELVRSSDKMVTKLEPLVSINERSIRHTEALEMLLQQK